MRVAAWMLTASLAACGPGEPRHSLAHANSQIQMLIAFEPIEEGEPAGLELSAVDDLEYVDEGFGLLFVPAAWCALHLIGSAPDDACELALLDEQAAVLEILQVEPGAALPSSAQIPVTVAILPSGWCDRHSVAIGTDFAESESYMTLAALLVAQRGLPQR